MTKVYLSILVLVFCTSCAVFAPDRFGYKHRNGTRDAKADLAAGIIRIKTFGDPSDPVEWRREYVETAYSRYHVEDQTIGLCVVDQFLVSYAERYNAVVEAYLRRTYGRDVLDELWDTLQKRYQGVPPPSEPSHTLRENATPAR